MWIVNIEFDIVILNEYIITAMKAYNTKGKILVVMYFFNISTELLDNFQS